MLHQLIDNLALLTAVLLLHGLVDQLQCVLVEMIDKIIEIILVSVRGQSLSSNPLNLVPFLMVGVMFHEEDLCHLL